MPRLRGILIQEESCLRFKVAFCRNIAVRQFGLKANVKGDTDALRAASRTFADKLATFEVKFPDAHLGAVVAFGNNTGVP